METVEFLQHALLLGLLFAVGFLLTGFSATLRLRQQRESDGADPNQEARLHRYPSVARARSAKSQHLGSNWIGG